MKEQLRELVYARSEEAFTAGDSARNAISTVAALRERQQRVRETFLAGMGNLPPMDTPLNPRGMGIIQDDGFRIEKIIFESRPQTHVTANLYVPDAVTSRRGAVLFLCGHKDEAKHADEYQVVCRHLVKAGLVVLAQDPIGQGERLGYYDPELRRSTCADEHDYPGAQCVLLGDGVVRYFLHDAMRGVDYLMSRPEVDPAKIGVTGNSGGGTQTAMMMLADPRIAAAAPGTFITNRRTYQPAGGGQDAEQIWWGFTAAGFDHDDILLAMCPKPVCVLAVTSDFFPIEGTRETVERCRRVWQMAGRQSDLDLVEDAATHAYTPALARAAARFFSQHLLGREGTVESADIRPIDQKRLWCTATGQVRGEIDNTRGVHDENQDRLQAIEVMRDRVTELKKRERGLEWLCRTVNFGRRVTTLNLRHHPRIGEADKLAVELGYWWSQKRLLNEGLLFRSHRDADKKLPVTLAVWDGGTTSLTRHDEWIRNVCREGRAVLVLNVSGVGGSEPNPPNAIPVHAPFGMIHKLNEDLVWLGDSLCALRVHDVLRAAQVLDEWPGVDASDVEVYAHGKHGLYAELAAAVEPRLARIEVVDAMDGFASWVRSRDHESAGSRTVLIPGILQYLDLSDIRRWRNE